MKLGITVALQKYLKNSIKAKKTLERLENWDTENTLKENSFNLGIGYQSAVQLANFYKLSHK